MPVVQKMRPARGLDRRCSALRWRTCPIGTWTSSRTACTWPPRPRPTAAPRRPCCTRSCRRAQQPHTLWLNTWGLLLPLSPEWITWSTGVEVENCTDSSCMPKSHLLSLPDRCAAQSVCGTRLCRRAPASQALGGVNTRSMRSIEREVHVHVLLILPPRVSLVAQCLPVLPACSYLGQHHTLCSKPALPACR